MKYFKPTQRLVELGLVLQYDSQKKAIFNKDGFEREMINQERAKIIQGNFDYWQTQNLEEKIKLAIQEIKQTNWQPEKAIVYSFTFNNL